MKIKAKLKGDVVEAKVMIKHDMLTYDQAKAKTGHKEDANFIVHIDASVNGKPVFDASTSQFLSKNPIVGFSFKGAKAGDKLVVNTIDLKGNKDSETSEIR
ncbi:MAG: thiosulfate oxidation carrier complex protein SoxZ [Thiovulaceae bacterium]|nr:thiosulfate oxidation carrier complex protein SoxZ [Sulfurimonadaceae bacterium]